MKNSRASQWRHGTQPLVHSGTEASNGGNGRWNRQRDKSAEAANSLHSQTAHVSDHSRESTSICLVRSVLRKRGWLRVSVERAMSVKSTLMRLVAMVVRSELLTLGRVKTIQAISVGRRQFQKPPVSVAASTADFPISPSVLPRRQQRAQTSQQLRSHTAQWSPPCLPLPPVFGVCRLRVTDACPLWRLYFWVVSLKLLFAAPACPCMFYHDGGCYISGNS